MPDFLPKDMHVPHRNPCPLPVTKVLENWGGDGSVVPGVGCRGAPGPALTPNHQQRAAGTSCPLDFHWVSRRQDALGEVPGPSERLT